MCLGPTPSRSPTNTSFLPRQLKDYYFGHHPANRFELSRGRALQMQPPAAAGPVNFLVHPYVEIGGKTVKGAVGSYRYTRAAEPASRS